MSPIIGRTCFNPLPYLSGKTDNNGDLVGNEMWLVDDRGGAMDLDQRLTLSENIKNAIAGKGFQYHDKYEKAVSFTSSRLYNRIMFLVNNTDNSMRCLPSLEETRDKLIIVKSSPIVFFRKFEKMILMKTKTGWIDISKTKCLLLPISSTRLR